MSKKEKGIFNKFVNLKCNKLYYKLVSDFVDWLAADKLVKLVKLKMNQNIGDFAMPWQP